MPLGRKFELTVLIRDHLRRTAEFANTHTLGTAFGPKIDNEFLTDLDRYIVQIKKWMEEARETIE